MTEDHKYNTLRKFMSEWVWDRCPGCGRLSKYANPPHGDFHSDGCPLEGLYQHTGKWWFEKEIERLTAERDRAIEHANQCEAAMHTKDEEQAEKFYTLYDVVRLMAVGRRPDGTYNRGREACEQMAKEALEKVGYDYI